MKPFHQALVRNRLGQMPLSALPLRLDRGEGWGEVSTPSFLPPSFLLLPPQRQKLIANPDHGGIQMTEEY